jgi:acetoin utilization deacetylase AcuC-like enzyme
MLRCFSSARYFAHLPPGHVFPMSKFPVSAQLIHDQNLARVIDPGLIGDEDLLRVHTGAYVHSIRTGNYNELTALRLGLPWHETISTRSHAATAGTLRAALASVEDGVAANLAGGTHHAFPDRGEGFCVFNDVAVAIRALQRTEPWLQVMIVDLDAHQGNGTNFIFRNDPNVFNFSVHVGRNYPSRKEPGDVDIELPRWVSGDEYLSSLDRHLPCAVERFEPDLVFFNAGVDVHVDDRFGQMRLSTADMRERDRFTLELCRRWGIPVTIVYGGGYNKTEGMTARLHVQTIAVAGELFSGDKNDARHAHRDAGTVHP